MKSNRGDTENDILQAVMKSIVWAPPPAPDIAVAAFIDDGTLDEKYLAECLTEAERNKATSLIDPVERRHLILRRCFQRAFLKTVLDWKGTLAELRIEHRLDSKSKCHDAPSCQLSFSSSGSTALACASLNHYVGIDVEKIRAITNALQLSQRFFTAEEAASISKCAADKQDMLFLRLWTAKEAGLKAIGKGIVSGLNSFVVKPSEHQYQIEMVGEFETLAPWSLRYLDFLPQHIVALMHRPADF